MLVALGLAEHTLHRRAALWVRKVAKRTDAEIGTCAITELGFLRVLAQAPSYSFTIEQGKEYLAQLKTANGLRFRFLEDNLPAEELPKWVRGAKQLTDGHLVALAEKHEAKLATLDRGIPGGFLVPENARR